MKCTVTQIIGDVIGVCKLGEYGKCYLTPEHPYREILGDTDKGWKIPYIDKGECVEKMYVDQVNNFVLEGPEHHVVCDNVECITLSHLFDDPVVKHPVWGTEIIHEYLKSLPMYPDVVIQGSLNDNELFDQFDNK